MYTPLIGITADADEERDFLRPAYCRALVEAGAVPVILPPIVETVPAIVRRFDGLVLSGGDDPIMEHWGIETHPKATPVADRRQRFEIALLDELRHAPEKPVLGICLGMQLMALQAGGRLDQHLPDSLPTAALHWGKVEHEISGSLGRGTVLSHHRQAVTDAGTMRVVAAAPDEVIEAVQDDDRTYFIGVQWHPERTETPALGRDLLRRFVAAAAAAASRRVAVT